MHHSSRTLFPGLAAVTATAPRALGGSANPDNWPVADMKAMMREHLDLTTAEVAARLNKDWAGDIAAYDKVHLHILVLADELTNGIVAQFPDAFVDDAQAAALNGE